MFSRSFSNIFRRIRDFFVPGEEPEELEIEDEDEIQSRVDELEQRIHELEQREAELETELETELEVPGEPDRLDTDEELDELEAQLDELEQIQEDEFIAGLTTEEYEILDAYGFISDDELQFRHDMADFFGVDILDLANVSIEDLEALSRAIIFDDDKTGEYVGSFSTVADITNSPLFDIIIDGYGDIVIDEDGNISIYEIDTGRSSE